MIPDEERIYESGQSYIRVSTPEGVRRFSEMEPLPLDPRITIDSRLASPERLAELNAQLNVVADLVTMTGLSAAEATETLVRLSETIPAIERRKTFWTKMKEWVNGRS